MSLVSVSRAISHKASLPGCVALAVPPLIMALASPPLCPAAADFEPPEDFLYQAVFPMVADDNIGFVQTRWCYTNQGENFLTWAQKVRGAGADAGHHSTRPHDECCTVHAAS